MDHLVHTHILLGQQQKRDLRRLAVTQDASLSAVLREAVDHYFRVVVGPTPEHLRAMARAVVGSLELQAGREGEGGEGEGQEGEGRGSGWDGVEP